MARHALQGIIAPTVLPMTSSGLLDRPSLECHLNALIDAGVHGLWINGTTGEFHALDEDTRGSAVDVAAKTAAGRVPVIAHVGDAATPLSIRQARAAVDAGADELAVIAPYFTPYGREELRDHYRAVADAVGFPVLAYHFPQLTPSALTVDCVLQLAEEGVLRGLKDSSGDLTWLRRVLRSAARRDLDLACFAGASGLSDIALYAGAAGATSSLANVTPRTLVALYEAARAGDFTYARALQERLEDLLEAMAAARHEHTLSTTVSTGKYVLAALGRIESAHAAPPLARLDAEEERRLDATVVPLVRELEAAALDAKERGDDS
ncbi:dihydrodipicolinate synthase family protein [Streptomyces sp. NBC_00006]|uniref:dihydrodipicolinate synthase family protein n=1 Tax=unclassified Streptomyces TaxID=2593676 RepID=UPI00225BB056|nr:MULTISPECIES: dihydrodipicolinate synthase family protein [unclassified Streptomyces]MCX5537056.1 dihydrodipicolinate synthase family protein [Streptomyces sp. NBC_00006]